MQKNIFELSRQNGAKHAPRFIIIGLVVVVGIVVGSTDRSVMTRAAVGDVPALGLVGHWNLNEGTGVLAGDTSGNGNDGALVNNPTWATGIEGSALSFVASGTPNNYVSFPSNLQNTNFPISGTLSFWINGDFTGQDNKCIFDCWAARDHVFVRAKLGTLQIVLQDPTGYLNSLGLAQTRDNSITTSYTNIPISPNTWTHIALAWDTVNDMGYLYKNGVQAVSFYYGAYNSPWTPSAQIFKLNDSSQTATALLDEVALYSRPLSPVEIQAIYDGTTPPAPDTVAPTAPANLASSSLAPNQVALGWDAATDDMAIGGYLIYRNGTPIGKVSATALAYTDIGLTAGITYSYEVYAFDTSGNQSPAANVSGTTTASSLLFQTDFEQNSISPTANIGGWLQWGPNADAATASTELSRAGAKAAKFVFNYSDWDGSDTNNHERAEITQTQRTEFVLGQTYWLGFSQYIPTTWENDLDTNAELIWQFHGWDNGPGSLSPPLALYGRGDELSMQLLASATGYYDAVNKPPRTFLATIPIDPEKGRWVDWVLQLNFNFDGGFVRAWKDGVQVVDYSGPTIYHSVGETNAMGPYVHFGVYKWGWGDSATQVSNRTLYTDEIRIGDNTTSCAVVKPTGSPDCEQIADTTTPAVSLTAPVSGANVSGTVSITADATDNTAVTSVEFYVDGALFSVDSTAPYSASWDTTSLPHNTTHTLTAKAYDSANNIGTSANVNVTVLDITLPTVSITSPANGAQVPRNSTVTIQATASDISGISKVEFRVGSTLKCTDTTAPYTCAWAVPGQKNVTYSLTAKAYDIANNVKTSTAVSVTAK